MAETFTRAYQSPDTRVTLLGPGWMNFYQTRIRTDAPPSLDLLFTMPNGGVERFKGALNSDRAVGTSSGTRVLTKEPDGTMVVTYEGTTWKFDGSGSLISVDNGKGDWVEIRYGPIGIASTLGPDGPGLRFDIGPDKRLVQVTKATDPAQFAHYEFDEAGRLIRATSSTSALRTYAYDGASQRITTISDDKGAVLLSLEYDDKGRVARERDAQGLLDGEAVSYVYEKLPDGSTRTTVTYPPSLIEPAWHPIQIATIDPQFRVRDLRLQPTSTQTFIGRYDWDSVNHRIDLQNPCPPPSPGPWQVPFPTVWVVLGLLLRLLVP